MRRKIFSLVMVLTILISNFNFVSAITPSAKIELDNYSVTISELKDVKISGTVSKAYGQKLLVKNEENVPVLIKTLPDLNGSQTSFEYVLASSYIKEGTNTYQVQSSKLLGKVSASNPKTFNITYKKQTTNVTQNQTSKKNQKITTSFDSYTFSDINKSLNINAKGNSGLKPTYKSSNTKVATVDKNGKVTAKGPGTANINISIKGNNTYNNSNKTIKITVPKYKNRVQALAEYKHILIDTYFYIYDRKYSFSSPTKYHTTNGKWNGKTGGNGSTQSCLTLPNVALKRLNLIGSNDSIWFNQKNSKNGFGKHLPSDKVKALQKNSKYLTITYPKKSFKSLANSGKLKYGDVVCRKGHTYVYMGEKKGKYNIFQCGSCRSIGNGAKVSWGHKHGKAKAKTSSINKQISNVNKLETKWKKGQIKDKYFKGSNAGGDNLNSTLYIVASINTFTIKTSCKNGSITTSNLYMAGQNYKIDYSPIKGKTLKEVKVDGKKVDIKKYPKSYTFKKLNKNHTISVVFN